MTTSQDFSMAQESILGSMIIDERSISEVLSGAIKPDDFYYETDQKIFKAARSLFLDGEKVDAVTVLAAMGSTQELRDRILHLMDVTPTAANIAAYVKIVREEVKLRKVRSLGEELYQVTHLGDAQTVVGQLNDLMMDNVTMRSVTMEQALNNFYDRIKQPKLYHTWGFSFLDEGLYAEKGDLVILGGRPSDGKTALALSMAYHQAKTLRVGFFSLETKEDKLFDRLFASVSKVSSSHIKRRALTEEDYEAFSIKAEEIKDRNLHLIRAAGSSVYDIQAYSRARRFDVIYVDYLQLVDVEGKGRVEQVTNISMGLHKLAQKNEITVVALSQLSRDGDGGNNKEKKKTVRPPRLSDLRESGQIEQDADIVLFVYREEPNMPNSRRIISVAKNKEGQLGQIPMLFNGDTQTFRPDINEVDESPQRKRNDYSSQVRIGEVHEEDGKTLPF